MSDKVKTFDELIAALPSGSGNPVVSSNGKAQVEPAVNFVKKASMSVPSGKVLKVTNFESVIITSRCSNAARTCFVWVSSYGDGQQLRTTACIMFSYPYFKWYINGSSESLALYIKNESSSPIVDYFSVASLTWMSPNLQIVDSVPTDATVLHNDLQIPGGVKPCRSISCDSSQKGGSHEYGRKRFIERASEGDSYRHCIQKKLVHRRKQSKSRRRVFCNSPMQQSASRCIQLWNLSGIRKRCLLLSNLRDGYFVCRRRVYQKSNSLHKGIFRAGFFLLGTTDFNGNKIAFRKEAVAA